MAATYPVRATSTASPSDGDRAIVAALYTQVADPDSALAVINRSLQLVDDVLIHVPAGPRARLAGTASEAVEDLAR